MNDWNSKLNQFDRNLIDELSKAGVSGASGTGNLISDAMVSDFDGKNFVERFGKMKGFSKSSVSRLATICQMMVYDRDGGPDGDNEQKGLRRHWYAWFKVSFAQDFSNQLGALGDKKEAKGFDGRAWAGRLSLIYSNLVDDEDVTYKDLWVSDASRLTKSFWGDLFQYANIILCVEKDSLFGDFEAAAKAIGAKVLVSGRGKMSKAATELVLRKHFNWRNRFSNPFSSENPLIVLSITDWDYDGESVIAPTFAEQARRYTEHVAEARVGIFPEQGIEKSGPLFEAKTNNATYCDWIDENGLFELECAACGHKWVHIGAQATNCPSCDSFVFFAVALAKGQVGETAYGYEVEAIRTRDYYPMIVDALLKVLDWETLVETMRDECQASSYAAAGKVWSTIERENETLKKLNETIDKLEQYRDAFEQDVKGHFQLVGEPHVDDWRDDDDDPKPEDFRQYVADANKYADAWRPFNAQDRTASLVHFLTYGENVEQDEVDDYTDYTEDVQNFIDKNIFKEYRQR
jgi:hypothetical protein